MVNRCRFRLGFLNIRSGSPRSKVGGSTACVSGAERNADDARLVFLCELGPPPYAMTDGDQRELSDRWKEALQIRRWAQETWADLEAEEAERGRS